jgi:hypothetical protein
MAITLGDLTLPQGLRWSDEQAWEPVVNTTQYSVTGALIVDTYTRQAGQPITLLGGQTWAWINLGALKLLVSFLNSIKRTPTTLILHDSRSFQVISATPAIESRPLAVVLDSGLANPTDESIYILEKINLLCV